MTDRDLMQQALEALTAYDGTNNASQRKRVLAALRERLAQPEQEPFCFHDGRNIVGKEYAHHCDVFPLYTEPQPEQKPLTEAAIRGMCERVPDYDISTHDLIQFARAIERAHGITGATP